jgi:hypothetical protein
MDIDQDGRMDIIVGSNTGALEYWRGAAAFGKFIISNTAYLGYGDNILRQNLSVAGGDLDGDGHEDLVIGDQAGTLSMISDFRAAGASPVPLTTLIYDGFSKTYVSKNLGGRIVPAIVNLFGTNKPEIVAGNTLGGLYMLRNDNGVILPEDLQVSLFPNPLPAGQPLSVMSDRNVVMELFTLLGQPIGKAQMIPANQIVSYPFLGVSAGVYIARFSSGTRRIGKRIIIL